VKRLLLAAGLAAALASPAAAVPTQNVTIHVERFFDPACQCHKLRFSGEIPSARPNEYVTIMAQHCGARSASAFSGASTRAGGSWSTEWWERGSATYRALWNGRLSDPVSVRVETRLTVNVTRQSRGRYHVAVLTSNSPQPMHGRVIELQRLAGGRWLTVRRVRLVARGSAGYGGGYVAMLKVRARGLKMRVFVPEKSAAPCFVESVSKTFVS
jgi:opacity protein-like surface antigen